MHAFSFPESPALLGLDGLILSRGIISTIVPLFPEGNDNSFYRLRCARASIMPSEWRSLLDAGCLVSTPIHACATAGPIFGGTYEQLCKKNISLLIHSRRPAEAKLCFNALAVLRDHRGWRMVIGSTLPDATI